MTKAVRHGKIFIDFFRNDYTATAVADFSVRTRPGTPVAVPLEWRELKSLKAANQFSMDDEVRRIKRKTSDPDRYQLKQRIPANSSY
jgi:bifunctional non-homologous end joining protein LigD